MHRLGIAILLSALPLTGWALEPSNPNSSVATRRLLDYLVALPDRVEHRLLTGQNVGHGPQVKDAYTTYVVNLHRDVGQWVSVVGADYTYGSIDQKWLDEVNATVTRHWNAGGLVTLCICSINNPVGDDGTYASFHDLPAVTTPGSDANVKWLAKLDRLAAALAVLRDAGVVVLWRPLHEMNLPDSKWWANSPPSDYIALWRQMHHYFSVEKKLDNLLWVFAPNGVAYDNGTKRPEDYYPGDDVVDVVGLDWYSDEPAKMKAGGYDALLAKGKPFGFTEYGPDISKSTSAHELPPLIADLKTNAPRAAFFWNWQSYGGHRMALVDFKNNAAGLADTAVLNCGDLDYTPADGGTNPRCAALDALPPAEGCHCGSAGSGLAALGALGSILRSRRTRRCIP